MPETATTTAEIQLDELGSQTIRVRLCRFPSAEYVDIRTYEWDPAAPGRDLHPTTKGVSVPLRHLRELLRGLEAIERSVVTGRGSRESTRPF